VGQTVDTQKISQRFHGFINARREKGRDERIHLKCFLVINEDIVSMIVKIKMKIVIETPKHLQKWLHI